MGKTNKMVARYAKMFKRVLRDMGFANAEPMIEAYRGRLAGMYASEDFARHDMYPTMNVPLVYAVIVMCLELREQGLLDEEIVTFSNAMFSRRRKVADCLTRCVNLLPNAYGIVERWNVSDHAKRVEDGSIDYDIFDVGDGRIEYRISHCMYVEMFEHYGIRYLCKIFCLTDERAYANLSRHVGFVRHSELSDGDCCHDEIINLRQDG